MQNTQIIRNNIVSIIRNSDGSGVTVRFLCTRCGRTRVSGPNQHCGRCNYMLRNERRINADTHRARLGVFAFILIGSAIVIGSLVYLREFGLL